MRPLCHLMFCCKIGNSVHRSIVGSNKISCKLQGVSKRLGFDNVYNIDA